MTFASGIHPCLRNRAMLLGSMSRCSPVWMHPDLMLAFVSSTMQTNSVLPGLVLNQSISLSSPRLGLGVFQFLHGITPRLGWRAQIPSAVLQHAVCNMLQLGGGRTPN